MNVGRSPSPAHPGLRRLAPRQAQIAHSSPAIPKVLFGKTIPEEYLLGGGAFLSKMEARLRWKLQFVGRHGRLFLAFLGGL